MQSPFNAVGFSSHTVGYFSSISPSLQWQSKDVFVWHKLS